MLDLTLLFLVSLVDSNFGAVVAPPWADPILNPCAILPRGWQMLYWPPDGKCYKIFKVSVALTWELGYGSRAVSATVTVFVFRNTTLNAQEKTLNHCSFFHYSKFRNRFTFACRLIHRMVYSFITVYVRSCPVA